MVLSIAHMSMVIFPYLFYIGVRGYPYGICCPWVRWGWGLDGLAKFFRRRRRRRRRPPWIHFPPISSTFVNCSIKK